MDKKINNVEQICSIKRVQYVTGRAKGFEVMIVNNGRLCFEVLVDKCMDIASFYHKGTSIGFVSAGGLNSGESEFEAVFNGGLLYTCGLDTIGGRAMPIHGRIHNIPADIIKAQATEYGIEITGVIKQCTLFGSKLCIERTIKTKANADTVEVIDRITNFSATDDGYCLLYHTNLAYPMIDDGVKITAPIKTTQPRTDFAKSQVDKCFVMENAIDGNDEAVFFHTVEKGCVSVENDKIGKTVLIEYDEEKLPYFIEWKSMITGAYALGIEPATSTLDDEFELKPIKAGETIETGIKITVTDKF